MMQDIVGPSNSSTHLLEMAQIPLDDFYAICKGSEMHLLPRRKVVEDADLLTALKQRFHEMGADESGTTGDYVESHVFPNGVEMEIATDLTPKGDDLRGLGIAGGPTQVGEIAPAGDPARLDFRILRNAVAIEAEACPCMIGHVYGWPVR